MQATRLDTREFNATLRKYMEVSRRDLATILNTKAFFIARRATIETPYVRPSVIRSLATGGGVMLGMIVNKRRGKEGKPGLWGPKMRDAIRLILAARVRSIAFLKSGWLESIKKLAPHAEKRGAPRQDRRARQVGRPKGDARIARPGWRPIAVIINAAISRHEKKDALQKYGGPALQRAIDFEVASMHEYMARKLSRSAHLLGIRTR